MLLLRSGAVFTYAALLMIALLGLPTGVSAGFQGVSQYHNCYVALRLTMLRNVD